MGIMGVRQSSWAYAYISITFFFGIGTSFWVGGIGLCMDGCVLGLRLNGYKMGFF